MIGENKNNLVILLEKLIRFPATRICPDGGAKVPSPLGVLIKYGFNGFRLKGQYM